MDLVFCDTRGFPIRKSAGRWIFAPNRSLSQLVTSFIGSQCQGIHLVLFLAWPLCLNLARVVRNCMLPCLFSRPVPILIFHYLSFDNFACSRSVFLLFSFQSTILASPSLAKTWMFLHNYILNSICRLIQFWDSNHLEKGLYGSGP